MYNLIIALVVKWISQRSSEPLLRVRILPRAQICEVNFAIRQDSNGTFPPLGLRESPWLRMNSVNIS